MTIKCEWMMCKHNTSNVPEQAGLCVCLESVSLKVGKYNIENEISEDALDEVEGYCFLDCANFEYDADRESLKYKEKI
jgi:hypothetical protein